MPRKSQPNQAPGVPNQQPPIQPSNRFSESSPNLPALPLQHLMHSSGTMTGLYQQQQQPQVQQSGSQSQMPQKPTTQKIEMIKQYYYQLSGNLRTLSQQLLSPDLPPARRQVLLQQQDKMQAQLNELTEKVLRPLMNQQQQL